MSAHNEKMAALLAADAPAAQDFAFQIAVMEKIEQRRYRRAMILNLGLTATAIALLALLVPAMEPVLQQVASVDSNNALILLIGASFVLPWWMTRRSLPRY